MEDDIVFTLHIYDEEAAGFIGVFKTEEGLKAYAKKHYEDCKLFHADDTPTEFNSNSRYLDKTYLYYFREKVHE